MNECRSIKRRTDRNDYVCHMHIIYVRPALINLQLNFFNELSLNCTTQQCHNKREYKKFRLFIMPDRFHQQFFLFVISQLIRMQQKNTLHNQTTVSDTNVPQILICTQQNIFFLSFSFLISKN